MKIKYLLLLLFFAAALSETSAQRRGGGFRSSGFSRSNRMSSSPMRQSSVSRSRQFSANKRSIFRGQKKHVLYKKINPKTGQTYIGRTSGYGSPSSILRKRDANHHINQSKGYGRALLLRSSTNKDAIRGAEHKLIMAHAAKARSGNSIRGISPKNPNREKYLRAADLTLRHTKKLPD